MNTNPHVHKPEIRRQYPYINEGYWELVYGDTVVRITNLQKRPSEKKVRRATRKAVIRHNRGSRAVELHPPGQLTAIAADEALNVAWDA